MIRNTEGVLCVGLSEDNNSVTLIRRRDRKIWYLPGGGIDDDETPLMAGEREYIEETGGQKLKNIISRGEYQLRNRFAFIIGDIYLERIHVLSGTIAEGIPNTNDEAIAVAQVDINNLPFGLPNYCKRIIHDAKNGIIYEKPKIQRLSPLSGLIILAKNPQMIPTFLRKQHSEFISK